MESHPGQTRAYDDGVDRWEIVDAQPALAADAGYVDQAHLARDVRDFSDMTPGDLRARLLPAAGGVRD